MTELVTYEFKAYPKPIPEQRQDGILRIKEWRLKIPLKNFIIKDLQPSEENHQINDRPSLYDELKTQGFKIPDDYYKFNVKITKDYIYFTGKTETLTSLITGRNTICQ